jgi:hypothetical protein
LLPLERPSPAPCAMHGGAQTHGGNAQGGDRSGPNGQSHGALLPVPADRPDPAVRVTGVYGAEVRSVEDREKFSGGAGSTPGDRRPYTPSTPDRRLTEPSRPGAARAEEATVCARRTGTADLPVGG